MNILVTVASKHGATGDIGDVVAGVLRDAGLAVETRAPDRVDSLDGFDAVILGSAVYAGRWMGSATHFADRFAAELASREVWLFSSGPTGGAPTPKDDPPRGTGTARAPRGSRASVLRRPARSKPARVHGARDHRGGQGARGRLPRLGRDS